MTLQYLDALKALGSGSGHQVRHSAGVHPAASGPSASMVQTGMGKSAEGDILLGRVRPA